MFRRLIKNIVLIVNLLVILGLLASGWAHLLNPANYPLLGIVGLMFPLFVIINAGFVVWWLMLRKLLCILSMAALLLFVNRLSDFVHFQRQKSNSVTDNNSFKVLSYNVRVFGLYNWKNNKQTRDSMFAFIRKESPDIACFQEYFNQDGNDFPVDDSLIHHQNFKHTHIHYTSINKSQKYGIATYSTFPIINKGVISFKHTSNLAIYSDIVIKQDTIRVFNCHLESLRLNKNEYKLLDDPGSLSTNSKRKGLIGIYQRMKKGYERRSEQAVEIKRQMDNSPFPVLLCGDFNDTPSSFVYYKLSKGLSDSHRLNGKGLGSTYTNYFPGFRIDYILFGPDFGCFNFNVTKIDFSDHRPIIGEYVIK
jgi:endonuclease/exonuclease/phosphatase family metal-dependent hydrolase